jgi:hypothetical protein
MNHLTASRTQNSPVVPSAEIGTAWADLGRAVLAAAVRATTRDLAEREVPPGAIAACLPSGIEELT